MATPKKIEETVSFVEAPTKQKPEKTSGSLASSCSQRSGRASNQQVESRISAADGTLLQEQGPSAQLEQDLTSKGKQGRQRNDAAKGTALSSWSQQHQNLDSDRIQGRLEQQQIDSFAA